QAADGGEEDRGIQLFGRELVRAAGPGCTQIAGELLSRRIAWFGEGKYLAALMAGHLRDEASGGSEAVESQPLGVARQDERRITYQAGAQERGRSRIAVTSWQAEDVAMIR